MVEHCVDIAGVASSILATPTTEKPASAFALAGFFISGFPVVSPRCCVIAAAVRSQFRG